MLVRILTLGLLACAGTAACAGGDNAPPPSQNASSAPALPATGGGQPPPVSSSPAVAPASGGEERPPSTASGSASGAVKLEGCPPGDPTKANAYRMADAAATIPLIPGLTIATVWTNPDGDYESLRQIKSVDETAITLTASAPKPKTGPPSFVERTICRDDLEHGHGYWTDFGPTSPRVVRGTTMFSVPAVYRELKATSGSKITIIGRAHLVGSDAYTIAYRGEGDMRRYSSVSLPVVVNDRQVELPALRAYCDIGSRHIEAYFLEDAANPITLDIDDGELRLRVVRISYPVEKKIENDLKARGRTEIYGIYFDFGSATLRAESEPVLADIAGVLARNPSWALDVEGHTDSLGGVDYNLDLSKRRAEAVIRSLIDRHHIDGGRLRGAGYGASRPKGPNDSAEGRALNRRVELARR